MATDLRSLPAYLSSDADFRSWGGGIAAQLAAVGLVQASDTGQINWTTVTKPVAINTYAGYEIWRFADSLQATYPVYVKIEYGVGGAVDRPALRTTISTATNGAGTPSGQVSPVRALTPTSSKTAGVTLPSYCSGSTGRLTLVNNYELSTTSICILIERTKDAAGAATNDAIVTYQFGGSTSGYQVVPFVGSLPTSVTQNCALPVNQGAISVAGLDVAVSPTVAFAGKPLFVYWCAYAAGDIGALTSFTVEYLGDPHTLMPLTGVVSGVVIGGAGSHALAIPWE